MKLILQLCLLLLLSVRVPAQPIPGKVSGGFQVPATRDNEGRRSVLKGSGGRPLGGGRFEITDARLTSFKSDDSADMIIEAPHCIFETARKVAHSDSDIRVKTADGRFSIKGVGWRWDSSTSQLIISNQVFATVRKAALADLSTDQQPLSSTSTNSTVEITSKTFMHESDLATFADDVVVEDGPDILRCGKLMVNFEGEGGVQRIEAAENVHLVQPDSEVRGGKAIYSVEKNTIELLGNTSWNAGDRKGSSEQLLLNRGSQTFFASGDVYMRLPTTNVVSLGGTTNTVKKSGEVQFLEIYSQKFTFLNSTNAAHPSHATYEEQVRVVHQQGEIRCGRLDIGFSASDEIQSIVARGDVEISSGPNKAFGQQAIYDLPADKLTITGDPRWQIEDKLGRAEKLILHPQSRESYAIGNVEMTLPGESLGPIATLEQANTVTNSASAPLKIFSETFSQMENIAVFHGNVRVTDENGTLTCVMLTVYIGEDNQVQRIIAGESVRIEQRELLATGGRADYNLATGLVHLTGEPRVSTPGRTAEARVFIIDRNRNTFSMAPGDWRITMQSTEKQKSQ